MTVEKLAPVQKLAHMRWPVMPDTDDELAFVERVDRLLACAYEFAAQPLDGIEEAAKELAALSADDLAIIERARRLTVARLMAHPDRATKQVDSLIRRAIEVGLSRWSFEDTGEIP